MELKGGESKRGVAVSSEGPVAGVECSPDTADNTGDVLLDDVFFESSSLPFA